MENEKTTYDELLYPTYAQEQSHPDILAVIGRMLGLSPAPVDRCRVLELGCGSGGNLIPMAYNLPRSSFVGIDLSARSIEVGQDFIAELKIENIELRHLDILDVSQDLGRFDYILCHGVFSWVEEPIRQRILAICRECLEPQGIAYISYNVYPGWHRNEMLRELLRYYAKRAPSPTEQARLARYLFTWLKTTLSGDKDERAENLLSEITHLESCDDSYVYHEYLIDENRPIYFHQFVEEAAKHDLRYLGDSIRESMLIENQHDPYAEFMRMCSGVVEAQQYLDFFLDRRFRYSLLCHNEREISMFVKPEVFHDLWVQATYNPNPALSDVPSEEPVALTADGGLKVSITGEPLRQGLLALAEIAPAAMSFDEFARTIVARCQDPAIQAEDAPGTPSVAFLKDLSTYLFSLYFSGIVNLHTVPYAICPRITEKPLVSPLSRLEGKVKAAVTAGWHRSMFLNQMAINLLQLLDGEHDRGQIVEGMLELGEEFKDSDMWKPFLDLAGREQQVDQFLEHLRAEGVLIG